MLIGVMCNLYGEGQRSALLQAYQLMYHAKEKNCGRKKVAIDMSINATIPLNKRTTLRTLAHELGVKTTTLHRCFKQGKIRRH
jgi:hypothetical protein